MKVVSSITSAPLYSLFYLGRLMTTCIQITSAFVMWSAISAFKMRQPPTLCHNTVTADIPELLLCCVFWGGESKAHSSTLQLDFFGKSLVCQPSTIIFMTHVVLFVVVTALFVWRKSCFALFCTIMILWQECCAKWWFPCCAFLANVQLKFQSYS